MSIIFNYILLTILLCLTERLTGIFTDFLSVVCCVVDMIECRIVPGSKAGQQSVEGVAASTTQAKPPEGNAKAIRGTKPVTPNSHPSRKHPAKTM